MQGIINIELLHMIPFLVNDHLIEERTKLSYQGIRACVDGNNILQLESTLTGNIRSMDINGLEGK